MLTDFLIREVGGSDREPWTPSEETHEEAIAAYAIEDWGLYYNDGDELVPESSLEDGSTLDWEILHAGGVDLWRATWRHTGKPFPDREWWDQPIAGRVETRKMDTSAPALVLVACGSAKLDVLSPASALYTGSLFRAHMTVASRYTAPCMILSAKHGVIGLESVIEPYDVTLSKMSKADRVAWAVMVSAQLRRLEVRGPIILLAGALYGGWKGLMPELEVVEPLGGLTLGKRLVAVTGPAEPPTRPKKKGRPVGWYFFFTTYRSSLKGPAFDEYWSHGAWWVKIQLPEDLTLAEAIGEAQRLGAFGKGTLGTGVFEVHNEVGVWQHLKRFRNISLCKPDQVEFKSWADLEAEELAA